MSSFALNAEIHYVESLKIFDRKSGQIAKNKEISLTSSKNAPPQSAIEHSKCWKWKWGKRFIHPKNN